VGSFAAVSGILALICHVLLEPAVFLTGADLLLIAVLGVGPLGGAFFLWDAALARGDPRRIGLLAFFTPLLSTVVIVVSTGRSFEPHLLVAAAMIIAAAVWGSGAR
jgi:drug/metabolite transporter (DMT)-like permease